jgi:Pyruvate/2-oxoacid:ferredoxin oxidoreductase gamma subunit
VLISPDWIDASKLPSARCANVALVGALSAFLPIEQTVWIEALRANLPERGFDANHAAFAMGQEAAAKRKEPV